MTDFRAMRRMISPAMAVDCTVLSASSSTITASSGTPWPIRHERRAIARGGVTGQGWCVAESFHLLEEALASRCEVKAVVAAESARPGVQARIANLPQVKLVVLPDALFQGVSATEASQGVMALV